MARNDNQNKGKGWFGDSKGHAEAGREGGRSQGRQNNPGNFANRDKDDVASAGRKGGSNSNKDDE